MCCRLVRTCPGYMEALLLGEDSSDIDLALKEQEDIEESSKDKTKSKHEGLLILDFLESFKSSTVAL